jgi:alpha-L-arabinofuranosidase
VHHVADLGPFPILDAAASRDGAGRQVALAVVNRDRDRGHRASIELTGVAVSGGVAVSEVNGPDVGATNSFEQPRLVDVQERRLEVAGPRFEYESPAHSVTVLRMQVG